MARRRRSKSSVWGLIVATGMIVAGHAVAQQPTFPTPVPIPDSQPTVAPPSVPTSQPSAPVAQPPVPSQPPVPVAPGTQVMPTAPQLPGGGGPVFTPAPFNPVQRFNFKINPNTPLKELLPTPPSVKPAAGPVLTDDLAKVPEAEFQTRPEKVSPDGKQAEQIAHQLAKINHVNEKKTDAFMSALLANREDLAGLPFTMGDDCRTSGERTKQFTQAVATVRQALNHFVTVPVTINADAIGVRANMPINSPPIPTQPVQAFTVVSATSNSSSFWSQYATLCEQEDAARSRTDKTKNECVTLARIAALMQMLPVESAEIRLGLVKYLTGIPHVEATKALAKMAIFSPEEDIRNAAIDSLKVRREKDYTDVLVKGLLYPWPAVAKRSAEAIARIGRTDLIPELVAVLASEDPRMPATKTVEGKPAATVREMVKINHHRNCMMCHSPGNPGNVSSSAITAEVPVQGQPLPLPSQGYGQSSPDLMVRIDVTYLRQDFSALLSVGDAHPWPDMQRFDFFVRERKLSGEEADEYKSKLTPKEAGVLSPYHRSALAALRELTGKDTAPTAEAWRKLLNLPISAPVKTEEGVKKVRG